MLSFAFACKGNDQLLLIHKQIEHLSVVVRDPVINFLLIVYRIQYTHQNHSQLFIEVIEEKRGNLIFGQEFQRHEDGKNISKFHIILR
jgi:hypothetical protein